LERNYNDFFFLCSMSPLFVLVIVIAYFLLLVLISHYTAKGADNESFFVGNRKAPWYLVAFGMIGASLSGVTFISVPGWVEASQFSYMQMVLGYLVGYFVIATVLMPLYYRLNLTSIYTYLETRFGFWSYKTGAMFFLISRIIGASFRLFLVAGVLQITMFDAWNVPFELNVIITVLLIWLYTAKGGIKTIIRTDALQTLFMLVAVALGISLLASDLDWGIGELYTQISNSDYSRVFFFDDWNDKKHFVKQFLSGAFMAIVMTGLDQDMMQKNLSCRNIKDAQKNMFWFSIVLVVVNFVFLSLGALLYLYATEKGLTLPESSDDLYPFIATKGSAGLIVAVSFLLGLIAAAYSSADSALTSLTTSVSVDFFNVDKKTESEGVRIRKWAHVILSVILVGVILIFSAFDDESVVKRIFVFAGYTYGPLLGMYGFGLFTKFQVQDKAVPIICVLSPIICYILSSNAKDWFNGYEFGFELLIVNGAITFLGMILFRKSTDEPVNV